MAKASNDTPWRDAIIQVMQDAGTAMHYVDIAEAIIKRKLRTSLGATPGATVRAFLQRTVKEDKSTLIKTAPGTYMLTSLTDSDHVQRQPKQRTESDECSNEIITAFGMFWRRELVDWKKKPKIQGCQLSGSDKVDFSDQMGVYFLYDGREVIYVGRCTDRPLGLRLYEHTRDRLATRWDRFSWFGILPVSDKGTLGKQPESFPGDSLIPALEALLIEAIEPRQNRKRGDNLSAVEFIQYEDTALRKKRLKSEMTSFLDTE